VQSIVINGSMLTHWKNFFDIAIQTLPPLHQDIVARTMDLPGKRTCLSYKEASRLWHLDRLEFDLQRRAAFESMRISVMQHGLSCPGDLSSL